MNQKRNALAKHLCMPNEARFLNFKNEKDNVDSVLSVYEPGEL